MSENHFQVQTLNRHRPKPGPFARTGSLRAKKSNQLQNVNHQHANTSQLLNGEASNYSEQAYGASQQLYPAQSQLSVNSYAASREQLNTMMSGQSICGSFLELPSASQLGFPCYATLRYKNEAGKKKVLANVEICVGNLRSGNRREQEDSLKYLSHATYKSLDVKNYMRQCGGIKLALEILANSDDHGVVRSCLTLLKNLSFSSRLNKVEMLTSNGIPVIAHFIRKEMPTESLHKALGLLWNLSATREVKPDLIKFVVKPLVHVILIPYVEKILERQTTPINDNLSKIALGIVSNIHIDQRDEDCNALLNVQGLVWSLLKIVQAKHQLNEVSDKTCLYTIQALQMIVRNYAEKQPIMGSEKDVKNQRHKNVMDQSNVVLTWDVDGGLQLQASVSLICNFFHNCSHRHFPTYKALLKLVNIYAHGHKRLAKMTRRVLLDIGCVAGLRNMFKCDDPDFVHSVAIFIYNLAHEPECVDQMELEVVSLLGQKLPEPGKESNIKNLTGLMLIKAISNVIAESHKKIMAFEKSGGLKKILFYSVLKHGPFDEKTCTASKQLLKLVWKNKKAKKQLKKMGYNKRQFKNES